MELNKDKMISLKEYIEEEETAFLLLIDNNKKNIAKDILNEIKKGACGSDTFLYKYWALECFKRQCETMLSECTNSIYITIDESNKDDSLRAILELKYLRKRMEIISKFLNYLIENEI